MEQITRKDHTLYYGNYKCESAEEAYERFRTDYNKECGKGTFSRLEKIGKRTERVHGFGFYRSPDYRFPIDFSDQRRTDCRLLGIAHTSYCRIVMFDDIPPKGQDNFWEWFEWAFSRGTNALRLVGRKDKSGRTSKRLRTRYR